MTTNDFFAWFFIIFSVVCYIKRDKSPFKEIWGVLSIFWLTLLAILAFGFIKEQLKKK